MKIDRYQLIHRSIVQYTYDYIEDRLFFLTFLSIVYPSMSLTEPIGSDEVDFGDLSEKEVSQKERLLELSLNRRECGSVFETAIKNQTLKREGTSGLSQHINLETNKTIAKMLSLSLARAYSETREETHDAVSKLHGLVKRMAIEACDNYNGVIHTVKDPIAITINQDTGNVSSLRIISKEENESVLNDKHLRICHLFNNGSTLIQVDKSYNISHQNIASLGSEESLKTVQECFDSVNEHLSTSIIEDGGNSDNKCDVPDSTLDISHANTVTDMDYTTPILQPIEPDKPSEIEPSTLTHKQVIDSIDESMGYPVLPNSDDVGSDDTICTDINSLGQSRERRDIVHPNTFSSLSALKNTGMDPSDVARCVVNAVGSLIGDSSKLEELVGNTRAVVQSYFWYRQLVCHLISHRKELIDLKSDVCQRSSTKLMLDSVLREFGRDPTKFVVNKMVTLPSFADVLSKSILFMLYRQTVVHKLSLIASMHDQLDLTGRCTGKDNNESSLSNDHVWMMGVMKTNFTMFIDLVTTYIKVTVVKDNVDEACSTSTCVCQTCSSGTGSPLQGYIFSDIQSKTKVVYICSTCLSYISTLITVLNCDHIVCRESYVVLSKKQKAAQSKTEASIDVVTLHNDVNRRINTTSREYLKNGQYNKVFGVVSSFVDLTTQFLDNMGYKETSSVSHAVASFLRFSRDGAEPDIHIIDAYNILKENDTPLTVRPSGIITKIFSRSHIVNALHDLTSLEVVTEFLKSNIAAICLSGNMDSLMRALPKPTPSSRRHVNAQVMLMSSRTNSSRVKKRKTRPSKVISRVPTNKKQATGASSTLDRYFQQTKK